MEERCLRKQKIDVKNANIQIKIIFLKIILFVLQNVSTLIRKKIPVGVNYSKELDLKGWKIPENEYSTRITPTLTGGGGDMKSDFCYRCKWYVPKGKIKGLCKRWESSPVLKFAFDGKTDECNEYYPKESSHGTK